jgi:lipoate-protein ligase B
MSIGIGTADPVDAALAFDHHDCRTCGLIELGVIDYDVAWRMQELIAAARSAGATADTLILLQHPHVFTLGRHGDASHILVRGADLLGVGATYYHSDRGGDATYHGPGQIVGYPILDLRRRGADVRQYVRDLEETLILTLSDFGIAAGRAEGLPGVWVNGAKIAAIGVKVSRWVSRHGFALNVDPDLRYFDLIVPCGLHGRTATSMAAVLGRPVTVEEVLVSLERRFAEVFGCNLAPIADGGEWLAAAGEGLGRERARAETR